MKTPEARQYPDLKALSEAGAKHICALVRDSLRQRDPVTVVLAGGKTPRLLYRNLASPPHNARMAWFNTHFFWGDERCVPPDHPDSNFGMAYDALLSRVPVPSENVHRIPAEEGTPEEAAEAYERDLRAFFHPSIGQGAAVGPVPEKGELPVFDLILLGLGTDGHTASLFPGDPVLEIEDRWVAPVPNPRGSPPVPRVTLTLPVINRARCVMFLVSGVEKRDVLRLILEEPDRASRVYPAGRIKPEGRLVWFADAGAMP